MKREWTPSEALGPYRLVERIAAGGMGEVWRAWDGRLKRPVAVKHVLPEILDRPGARERLRREAEAGARLTHPAVVQIYDLVESPEGDWIVMELVAGKTLRQLFSEGPLAISSAVRWGAEIAGGLAAAHAQGILHRDLKAGNVMITEAGHSKVLDFGIARSISPLTTGQGLGSETTLSQPGSVVGTLYAMSPEQAMGLPLGPRSDLFSLGSLLYEMFTGKAPFRADSPTATLARVCSYRPRSARQLRAEIPVEVSLLVDRLLEKEPSARPKDAGEAAARLEDAAGLLALRSPSGAASADAALGTASEETTLFDGPPRSAEVKPASATWAAIVAGVSIAIVLVVLSFGGRTLGLSSSAVPTPTSASRTGTSEFLVGRLHKGPLGMRFHYVPSGTYTIGSPKNEPGRVTQEYLPHQVHLTRGFWLAETEVTKAQWSQLLPRKEDHPWFFKTFGTDRPVESVSWFAAAEFANRVSALEGLTPCYQLKGCTGRLGATYTCEDPPLPRLDCSGYRLPTEAEWEIAARAGTRTAIYTGRLTIRTEIDGPELDAIAWYGGNSGGEAPEGGDCAEWVEGMPILCGTQEVRQKKPNAWGFYDMLGNVYEWTQDWYGTESPRVKDPQGPAKGLNRAIRGGSWGSASWELRAACRYRFDPSFRWNFLGFRLARSQSLNSS
jgi:serine/threonine-protein kinase